MDVSVDGGDNKEFEDALKNSNDFYEALKKIERETLTHGDNNEFDEDNYFFHDIFINKEEYSENSYKIRSPVFSNQNIIMMYIEFITNNQTIVKKIINSQAEDGSTNDVDPSVDKEMKIALEEIKKFVSKINKEDSFKIEITNISKMNKSNRIDIIFERQGHKFTLKIYLGEETEEIISLINILNYYDNSFENESESTPGETLDKNTEPLETSNFGFIGKLELFERIYSRGNIIGSLDDSHNAIVPIIPLNLKEKSGEEHLINNKLFMITNDTQQEKLEQVTGDDADIGKKIDIIIQLIYYLSFIKKINKYNSKLKPENIIIEKKNDSQQKILCKKQQDFLEHKISNFIYFINNTELKKKPEKQKPFDTMKSKFPQRGSASSGGNQMVDEDVYFLIKEIERLFKHDQKIKPIINKIKKTKKNKYINYEEFHKEIACVLLDFFLNLT